MKAYRGVLEMAEQMQIQGDQPLARGYSGKSMQEKKLGKSKS
mgnify:CR=1 FL=1